MIKTKSLKNKNNTKQAKNKTYQRIFIPNQALILSSVPFQFSGYGF